MIAMEPNLPWEEAQEDRLFNRMVIAFVFIFLLLGIILNNLSLPEVQQKQLLDVSPRLAKLIMEKIKIPPPPPLKKVIKKPEKKTKAAPKPKPVAKPDSRAAAKKTAQQSGLIALSDELADLRESFDFSDIAEQPQQKTGKQAETVMSTSAMLMAKASRGSDGIKTDTLNRKIDSSELRQRKTSNITSTIDSSGNLSGRTGKQKSSTASRNQEEIERVFQKNKGAIFSIYNRELRKDPSLQGKVVIELTIAPNGTVTRCTIISSELGHKKLEKRLLSKIKKFKFASKNVPVITVTYPIDFLPS
jgi:protein TonB